MAALKRVVHARHPPIVAFQTRFWALTRDSESWLLALPGRCTSTFCLHDRMVIGWQSVLLEAAHEFSRVISVYRSKPVPQQEPMGCAISAVAAVLGCSYYEAKQWFDGLSGDAESYGYKLISIKAALRRAGRKYVWCAHSATRGREKFARGSIVLIRMFPADKDCHFLVRDSDNSWLDSMDGRLTAAKSKALTDCWRKQKHGSRWSPRLPSPYVPHGTGYLAPG
jgi:hypothetical protein